MHVRFEGNQDHFPVRAGDAAGVWLRSASQTGPAPWVGEGAGAISLELLDESQHANACASEVRHAVCTVRVVSGSRVDGEPPSFRSYMASAPLMNEQERLRAVGSAQCFPRLVVTSPTSPSQPFTRARCRTSRSRTPSLLSRAALAACDRAGRRFTSRLLYFAAVASRCP